MEIADGPPSQPGRGVLTRRHALKRLGAGTALVWAVPEVTSFGVPAAAGTPQGCGAFGAGTIEDWPHCPFDSDPTTFTFAASRAGGGSASGTFSFVCGPSEFGAQAFSGIVSCLTVNGDEATIGGTVTASTSGAIPNGTELSFTVLDAGAGGTGDEFGVLITGSNCVYDSAGAPLTSGDIVVEDCP